MRAAVIDELGQVPRLREVAEPEVPEGQVLARVRAVAVKNIERMLAAGTHYGSKGLAMPAQLGVDAVAELPDGRRVYTGAAPPAGTLAEYLPVDPRRAFEIPAGVTDAAAAALPNAALSAWFALEYGGQIRSGQSVLLLGATGVTGGLAVQLAKRRFGAGHVLAVGRDTHRLSLLRERGADATIALGDSRSDLRDALRAAHAEHPFDLVVDYLWGTPAEDVLAALANDDLTAAFHRTRFVQVGESAAATLQLPASVLRSAGVELVGQGAGSVPPEALTRAWTEILPTLFGMLADGNLSIETVTRPLDEVAAAWTEPTASGVRTVLAP